MSELKQLARDFWEMMSAHYGTTVVDKGSALEMEAVKRFLDWFGIVDADEFMARFTTTIGRTIYIPFTIGVGTDRQVWRQITTCVHEHEHVAQSDREGMFRFQVRYALDRDARAQYEAEAYRCNLEMHFWRYGTMRDPQAEAAKLENYGVNDEQIAFVAKYLAMASPTIARGGIASLVTRFAIAWLEEHAPELHHRG